MNIAPGIQKKNTARPLLSVTAGIDHIAEPPGILPSAEKSGRRDRNTASRQPGNLAGRQDGNLASRQPGSMAGRRDGNLAGHQGHFHIQHLDSIFPSSSDPLAYFEIWWFRTGSPTLNIDGTSYTATPGTIFCLTPGQQRLMEISAIPTQPVTGGDPSFTGTYIRFCPGFLNTSSFSRRVIPWLDPCMAKMISPALPIDADTSEELADIIKKMSKEYASRNPLRREILSGLLNVFTIHLSRRMEYPRTEPCNPKEWQTTEEFLTMLRSDYTTKKLVAEYARALHLSASHLNRIVKKTTSYTASHHIQQQILQAARQQAIQTSHSMKEIAYHLGYEDISYFSKFFKKNMGASFSEFRRRMRS